jgi:hypothetical protein
MTFLKRSENNGLIDSAINTKGRPREDQNLTKRELREKEFTKLARKFLPHVGNAIIVASKIMNDPKAAEAPRLKACTIILDNYHKLLDGKLYDGDDEDGTELQPNQPKTVFSLHMLPDPKDSESKE